MKKRTRRSVQPPPHPYSCLPRLAQLRDQTHNPLPPEDDFCFYLWDKYNMLDNVRRHSLKVAHIASILAQRACDLEFPVQFQAIRAAGLLHDLAKTWCIAHGGSHAMLGSAWTLRETRHYGIAQGVLLHVHWPWSIPKDAGICTLPFFVIYADKRVQHDVCVTLQERFDDLIERYGKTEEARQGIKRSMSQAQRIEKSLSEQLKMELHENSFDCGRLVS